MRRAVAAYGDDISRVRESSTSMTSTVTESKAKVRRNRHYSDKGVIRLITPSSTFSAHV